MLVRSRHGLAFIASLALGSLAASASAQDDYDRAGDSGFARSGVLALGVDRVFGVLHVDVTRELPMDVQQSTSVTEISLLTGGAPSPYALPRIAFDGFVTDGISIGATAGVISQSTSIEAESDSASSSMDGPSGTGIVFGGRVGYGHMFTDMIGIWPKLGLTFFTMSTESDDGDESSLNGLALSADVALLILPVSHFGFTIAPLIDLGLTGSDSDEDGPDVDTTITDFGLHVGLLGWL